MTIGDKIWAEAVRDSGILMDMPKIEEIERWRPFALSVIRKINESHGIREMLDEEDEERQWLSRFT